MTYLTTEDVIYLHARLIAESGGLAGIKNPGSIESSVAQPTMTFDGVELYPTLAEKADRPSRDGIVSGAERL
jgi:death on curing protein